MLNDTYDYEKLNSQIYSIALSSHDSHQQEHQSIAEEYRNVNHNQLTGFILKINFNIYLNGLETLCFECLLKIVKILLLVTFIVNLIYSKCNLLVCMTSMSSLELDYYKTICSNQYNIDNSVY